MKNERALSSTFSTARIYFLISIVAAHLSFPGTFSSILLSRIGTLGVVGFLVMAGYFYNPSKFGSFANMLKKKAISVVLPWFVMGFITWGYNAVLVPQRRSVVELLKWVFGNGTFLYYMPVLVLCFVFFYKHNKVSLSAAVIINLVSVVLTAAGVLKPVTDALHITSYLNGFNWFGFFALGMLLQSVNEEMLQSFFKRYRFLFIGSFAICYVTMLVLKDVKLDYFSYLAIPYELMGVMAVFSVSTFNLTDKKIFSYLSSSSFTIYLIHMIFIGLLDGYLAQLRVLRLLSPIIIILPSFLLLMIGFFVSKKIKLEKLYCLLTGLRIK